ncbi:MAG: oxidoreductase, partial [Microbacterium sp.]|nr:oxidoreductase [Microbacterium sp.]
ELAARLRAQDGLYTLVERGESGERGSVIGSISRAHAGDDLEALVRDLRAPATVIVTLTITEVGYRFGANGGPDIDDPMVVRDRAELARVSDGILDLADARPETALGRLLLGLEARRRDDAGALAILSCDNLPDNGGRLRRGLVSWAAGIAPDLCDWMIEQVEFVSSSVDRITPKIAAGEEAALRERYQDDVPVVAEPFRDWVISGRFPGGRPAWETAGARFVDDLEPWEARKLWLLNGAHTLLACLGLLRGHETVADAIVDTACRAAVEALWDDAVNSLPPDVETAAYRAALLRRFENPRIAHQLRQIAQDTDTKVQVRIVPVAESERVAGRGARGCAAAMACWVEARGAGLIPASPAFGDITDPTRLVARASTALGKDETFMDSVLRQRLHVHR